MPCFIGSSSQRSRLLQHSLQDRFLGLVDRQTDKEARPEKTSTRVLPVDQKRKLMPGAYDDIFCENNRSSNEAFGSKTLCVDNTSGKKERSNLDKNLRGNELTVAADLR